jgi:transcriptional regulator with XRE-family HTH domain
MSSTLSPQGAKKLGRRIKEARTARGFRQADLAKLVGVSTQSISAFESGRIPPAREYVEKIAHHTQRPLHFFTGQKVAEALARVEQMRKELDELQDILRQAIDGE